MTHILARHRTRSLRTLLRAFHHDERGATAVLVGLSIIALAGFAGLATEVGTWYTAKRGMQGAADAAAFGAAVAVAAGNTVYSSEAKSIAASYGYTDQVSGTTVSVNSPPTLGNYTGNPNAIEVIVQRPEQRMFSALFSSTSVVIKARAVAVAAVGGPACVLALNTGIAADVFTNGTTQVNLTGCALAVNSNSGSALNIVGGAIIDAQNASIVGGVTGNGTLNTTDGTVTGANPTPDPYQDVQMPSYSGCNQSSYNPAPHSTQSIDASGGTYVFCNGASIGAGATVNLSNGTYIIDRGTLSIDSQSTLNVSNATIILTSSTGSNYATVSVAGGATVNVTAPSTGPTAGLAFFQDRNAPADGTNSFTGGATQNITGAIYMPNQEVSFAGGTQTGGTACTQIVADEVDFKGNANLNSDCTGVGTRRITIPPDLVE